MSSENRNYNNELAYYRARVQDHIFWEKRSVFILLMENFINNVIMFQEFESKFSILHSECMKEFRTVKFDLNKLQHFNLSSESNNYCSYINGVFRQFEEIEDEICSLEEAKIFIISILAKIS
jgi:hypothetical protein